MSVHAPGNQCFVNTTHLGSHARQSVEFQLTGDRSTLQNQALTEI